MQRSTSTSHSRNSQPLTAATLPSRKCLGDAVRRHCPPWLQSETDDICQTASVRLLRKLREEPVVHASRTYLQRAAKNAVIDAVRSHATRERHHKQVAVVGREGERTPEQLTADRELRHALADHVERLPAARQEAVTMYMGGHGIAEIAKQLGCGTKRIDNLVYRGLRSLRESLTTAGITPATHRAGL